MKKVIPQSLRTWFLVHFIVDTVFAVPLLIAPAWLFNLFGFSTVEPVTARLLGAGLLGIGASTLLSYKKEIESYASLLNLKIVWSLSAIAVIIWSLLQGEPSSLWIILIAFLVFASAWIYYKRLLSK